MIQIFQMNDDNEIEVDNILIYSTVPFRKLIEFVGKDSVLFTKVMTFVYLNYDYFSPLAVEPDERKLKTSLSMAGLDETFDYKNKVILELAKYYTEQQENIMPAVKMYKELNAGIVSASAAVRVIRKNIDITVKNAEIAEGMRVDTTVLNDELTALMTLTAKLEGAFKALNSIEEKLRNEKDSSLSIAKGEKQVGMFEDAD